MVQILLQAFPRTTANRNGETGRAIATSPLCVFHQSPGSMTTLFCVFSHKSLRHIVFRKSQQWCSPTVYYLFTFCILCNICFLSQYSIDDVIKSKKV
ncbi:hypothetical protein CEXT_513211 [Caerostris extrusa]|uniref:Uncharacterized protein n=1 Tax=Caerostris extrusa TaxID=172846 RepID=A0AAV4VZW2_CAEEX|nr:hypothetical protein CEXT_513211 [Caerostris extrusa]